MKSGKDNDVATTKASEKAESLVSAAQAPTEAKSEAQADADADAESKAESKSQEYDYACVHNDLEKGIYSGAYGWDNACYLGIAEKRAKIDMSVHHSKRSKDEFYMPSFKELLANKETQAYWDRIVTFDPFGMTATIPTIAATTAILNIPELKDLERDGKIVDKDGGINTVKAAVYYAWNLPGLSHKLELSEKEMRDALFKYTGNPKLKDSSIRVFLPPVGGMTVYTFGDIRKIRDKATEIAVRVHDECNGSDVFGTDICTCRPYLMFALRACVECAQRGGVGIIVYFRKEGRSLGEVTKYRVYNARRNQKGGDSADKYFYQTESIAGIVDARFQVMMPDVLNWLGIDRIDWLLSMSSEKYDALVNAGIRIIQRVSLPDTFVPKNAVIEITAKVAAGYHADAIKTDELVNELRDLRTIRKQCLRIFDLAKRDELNYWRLNMDNLDNAVKQVKDCIDDHYPNHNIPLHSRFRHFDERGLNRLMKCWDDAYVDRKEQVRRLVDLTMISVLLDAGAGSQWHYIDQVGTKWTRSEGLAVASFDMFTEGYFSSDPALKTRVNSVGLSQLSPNKLRVGFQVSQNNPMIGLKGRSQLLQRLGKALENNPEYFGTEIYRPGHILDYCLRNTIDGSDNKKVSIRVLWKAIVHGLESIWPEHLSGVRRGDVWIHNSLKEIGKPGSDFVPFHKLQQWLCYSLMEALHFYGLEFVDVNEMTALAEYRNGGLYVDTKVLNFKSEDDKTRYFDVGSELIVEWRAMTIILTDMVADRLRKEWKKSESQLPLSKILEGGTWRAGRELAFKLRGGKSPVNFRSDGTVF